jgi:hypothetical protein
MDGECVVAYNPELVKQLLGDKVSDLFDGTIEISRSKNNLIYGNLKVGDTLSFKLKESDTSQPLRQFVITGYK